MRARLGTLAARLETRLPLVWQNRWRLVIFSLLFMVFFMVNQAIIRFPETLRHSLANSPLAENIAYSDVVIHLLPPELTLTDAVVGDPALPDVLLLLDTLTIRPFLGQLFGGKIAFQATASAGRGTARLDAASSPSFDLTRPTFTLQLTAMPLPVREALNHLAPPGGPAADAATALAGGRISPSTAAGLLFPRGRDLTASGRIEMIRDEGPVLVLDRVRLEAADRSSSISLNGRIRLNWRNLGESDLDITAVVQVGPDQAAPLLRLDDMLRQRLDAGQPLTFALTGTLGALRLKPVF